MVESEYNNLVDTVNIQRTKPNQTNKTNKKEKEEKQNYEQNRKMGQERRKKFARSITTKRDKKNVTSKEFSGSGDGSRSRKEHRDTEIKKKTFLTKRKWRGIVFNGKKEEKEYGTDNR